MLNSNILYTNCAGPQRFKDTVFTSSQILLYTNIGYRHVADYAPNDSVKSELTYDYYQPLETDASLLRPLIILLPGGGFTTLTDMGSEAKRFARYGYCVAIPKYRINPRLLDTANYFKIGSKVGYEEVYRAVQDIRFAIRLAKRDALLTKIDTNNIFVGGVSAGAIIALHVAYADANEITPSLINIDSLGVLDYGGNLNNTAKIRGVFAHSGGLTGLGFISSAGDVPAFNLMSLKDTYYSVDCANTEYTYRRLYFCGPRAVSQQLSSFGIVNKLVLLDDAGLNVPPVIPGNFSTHSHGSVFYSEYYRARDVESTVSFIYRTFFPNPCP